MPFLCFFGMHSGICLDGAYRCLSCSYVEPYDAKCRWRIRPRFAVAGFVGGFASGFIYDLARHFGLVP